MWRYFLGGMTILFGAGALAGLMLIVFSVVERDYPTAGRVLVGTLIFAGIAWVCRRDWQRAQQERAFRRKNGANDG